MLTTKELSLTITNLFVLFLFFFTNVFSQDSPYQVIRLNEGNPIIEPSMFSNQDDGLNINGPSLIRIPDWIPVNERANVSAQYYLYFAHHVGDYIRMAWATNIEGPYTLYDDEAGIGNRGVLDNNEADIFLDNDIRIEENHLASPDVIVDDVNQRIIMYFHSGSSFFVGNEEQSSQVTWVSTSPYGLEFYNGIESVHLGSSYFRVFEYDEELYALDNGAKINRALNAENPWAIPTGYDFTEKLWDLNPNHVFQDDIPVPSSELRVRHTGVRVVGNQLHVFYSRRGEIQERIQLSTVDLSSDWTQWDPTYPPIEVLTPNPGWEGGQLELDNSKLGAGVDVNQLRDPDVFEDTDGQLYLIYTGNGEGGIGIAKLYETPTVNMTLTTIADTHIKESTQNNNFGSLSKLRASTGLSSSDERTIYMKFDLSQVTNLEHAVVRLYVNQTTQGPVTVYETSDNWQENSLTAGNAPPLGKVITTTYLTNNEQYYDWNITEYAKENTGSTLNVAFDIAPSNEASHEFGSLQSSNPAVLLLVTEMNDNTCGVLIDENNFDSSYGIWNDGGTDCRRNSGDALFANGGTGACIRLRDDTDTSLTTTDALDLSEYSNITIDFNYITDLVESGEDFWLQVSTDGGNIYNTVEDWIAGAEFENGVRNVESVTIEGPFSSNTHLRFRMDASANSDLIYIDDVKITGCLEAVEGLNNTTVNDNVLLSTEIGLLTYPNPFLDSFTIEIPNYNGQSEIEVELINMSTGSTVLKQIHNQSIIELTNIYSESGIYVLKVIYDNEKPLIKTMIKID